MEDYTLTNSMGKITTRADDIAEAKKNDPNYEIFENYSMKVRVHGDTAVVTGKTHTKGISGGKLFDFQFQFKRVHEAHLAVRPFPHQPDLTRLVQRG